MREALAATDHDFVLSEPASKLRQALRIVRGRGLSRAARRSRRYLSVAAAIFFVAAIGGILLNALVWQRTRHPAPFFSHAASAVPAREPRVSGMMAVPDAPSMQARDKPIEKLPLEPAASAHPPHVRVNASPVTPNDEISQLLKAPPVQRPLAAPPVRPATTKVPPAAPKKSVMAAQRALVTLGFVLNPDGIAGKTTRQAVERYERDRGLPVRGDLTPALMRRLSSETGVAH